LSAAVAVAGLIARRPATSSVITVCYS
jgi:hypothetical protein